ncbi:NUDIX domain-containing protein [Novosphingobium sp. THN1]|uniref:NUDIX domain-containing protein n=1 Tax=Novosphingobium sp. THN1 TaxID=1016987 RepID=UPI0013C2AC4D|nr:NUDIX domain-containing protein [Novosphingobium sp. THN1]
MLHFLPGPLHRTVLRVAHAARLWYWRITRKRVRGCNVIAANAAGEVLLVRHSYHARDTWMLPGGGLGRNERPEATALRELFEETGCRLAAPRHLGTVLLDRKGWTNAIELVAGTTADLPAPDGREIAEARFFPATALPDNTVRSVREMIARWLADQNGSSA